MHSLYLSQPLYFAVIFVYTNTKGKTLHKHLKQIFSLESKLSNQLNLPMISFIR